MRAHGHEKTHVDTTPPEPTNQHEHRQLQADAALTEAEIQRQLYGEPDANPYTPQALLESWGHARFQFRPRRGDYRHDSYHQAAHQLARHGWKGEPDDRMTGYRGRNDQMRREHDAGESMRDLGREHGVAASTVCRAIKEAKHREVAVSEAIRAKMAREPAAEAAFLWTLKLFASKHLALRTVSDSRRRGEFFSLTTTQVNSSRGQNGGNLRTGFQLEGFP